MQQQLKRLTGTGSRWLLLFIATASFIVSCKQKGTVTIPVPEDTSALSKINHFIPLDQISAYQRAFNIERDTLLKLRQGLSIPQSEAFNKPAIIELLKDPACVGIRVSYGIKQTAAGNEFRLILTGVDAQGNDLYIAGETPPPTGTNERSANAPLAAPAPAKGGLEQGQCNPPCR